MSARLLLLISVGLNLVFAAFLFFGLRNLSAPINPPAVGDIDSPARNPRVQTKVMVRRQNFTWQEVESNDYATYIKNLREIGCPDATIRDIIVADVNELYSHRRASEVVSADHQWWKSEPDIGAVQAAAEKLKMLEAERKTLLTRLLGPGWDVTNNPMPPPARTGISLTGPVLGELAPETKQAVYDIAAQTQLKIEAYQEAQRLAGKEIDPMELTRMRQESRGELAKVLNPAQMEEFLLRYSSTAFQMRTELRGLDFTPDEFRNFFKARDPIDQQTDINYNGTDPEKLRRKKELETQRDTAVQQALGKERYGSYKLYQDPLFQQSRATAEQMGASAELVLPIYQINQLTESERQRIRNDTTLSNDEKVDAIASAQAEQQKSLEKILGPEVLQRYLQGTNSVAK